MGVSFSCNSVSNKNQKQLLLTEMVFSLNIINTMVDGNGFAFSLRYIPYKSRSKAKSIFVCYETIVI